MAFLMLGTGAFLTARLRFFQFTHLKSALRAPFEKREKNSGAVSPYRAMATALGASVGTANIAGVAGAIALGGPGAVFWMWAAGLLGMATKLCETVLAMRYRDMTKDPPEGGAMRYMELGLGRIGRPLGLSFSVFGCLAALMGTALVQSNTIAAAGLGLAASFGFTGSAEWMKLGIGLLTAIIAGIVILGGAKRIGAFAERAVPVMAVLYIAAGLIAVFINRERLAEAFCGIFRGAFGLKQAAGGTAGYGMARALRVGVARGVYSNEAGVGSSTMAHAGSSERDPVKQGLLGIFEVFADTLVMCSVTALVILTCAEDIKGDGMALVSAAFASVFGERPASVFLCICILLFAFTSLTGWSLYGARCAEHISRRLKGVSLELFLLLIPFGAAANVRFAWRMGELFNYLMALPNVAAIILLSKEAAKELDGYKMFEKSRGKRYNKG